MANDQAGTGSTPTLAQTSDIPLLPQMNARGRRVALSYYEAGVLAGIGVGRAQAESEMAALWHRAHGIVQDASRQPGFAELARRRGEPHRAERAEQLLRDRGVTR